MPSIPRLTTAKRLEKSIAGERTRGARGDAAGLAGLPAFPDKKRHLAAVARLKGSHRPAISAGTARPLGTTRAPIPSVRKAADACSRIDHARLQLVGIGVNLFEGICLGSILLLAAIGLPITFGVMGVINMAHGEMIMLGAYSAFVVQQFFRAFLPPGSIDAYLSSRSRSRFRSPG